MGDYPLPRDGLAFTPPSASALAALQQAQANLRDGCQFLIRDGQAHADAHTAITRPTPAYPPAFNQRRAGNALRELDRMLAIMLEACAWVLGASAHQLDVWDHWQDTSGKLRRIEAITRQTSHGTRRLHAIARLRRHYAAESKGLPQATLMRDWACALDGADMALPDTHASWGQLAKGLGVIANFYLGLSERLADRILG
ncbi:hypothetical protein EOE18_09330 [Novosphingobium umbonatum]|uniref:Uncharacterized protein n=1 Tax=Novosphingobium umbonatum TaxID=1908524 RepID=A0A3S2Y8S6_9SPHN|nr:hypothetical protein [Novosphingobium umbonatum]RVU04940.1 hypothetical protein EOE18_09330 [Novosphingobium umbonatum]